MKTLFQTAIQRTNDKRPPVWFMRQAGRYHHHYQALRKKYSFIELCKLPEIACEATLGPIQDFNFDAAILFSDLLFPLEVMGMGLSYPEGPQLDWHLKTLSDTQRLKGGVDLISGLLFQGDALKLIRKKLPLEKSLLGFVGGPLTLFCYAVEGKHKGNLDSARKGLLDGRFEVFCDKLSDLLIENMLLQARSGADGIALLDTCAGEFGPQIYAEVIAPSLKQVMQKFKKKSPETPLIYYSKGTGPEHWKSLKGFPMDCLGIDWNHDLAQVLEEWSDTWSIQGNVDPHWLLLDSNDLESRLRKIFSAIQNLPSQKRRGWICGLGHGILPKTPESNVKLFLQLQKEYFEHQE